MQDTAAGAARRGTHQRTTLIAVRDLRITGVESGGSQFRAIGYLDVTSGGHIVVFDFGTRELRIFDNNGRSLKTLAGGKGGWTPGYPLAMASHGDTLAFLDQQARSVRVSLIPVASGGAPVVLTGAALLRGERPILMAYGKGRFWFLLEKYASQFEASGIPRIDQHPVFRIQEYNRDLKPTRAPWRWLHDLPREIINVGNEQLVLTPLFAVLPSFRFGNESFYFSRGHDFWIERTRLSDQRRDTIVIPTERVPIGRELLRPAIQNRIQEVNLRRARGDTAFADAWMRLVLPRLESLPAPTHRPVLRGIWPAADGSFAVRRNDIEPAGGKSPIIIDLVTAQGAVRGRLEMPPNVEIRAYTGQHLIAVEAVANAQAVVRFRLVQ